MKIIYNKYIPFKGFVAINLFGWIFVRRDESISTYVLGDMLKHEKVHTQQMKRDGYVYFYCKYIYEYIRNLIKYRDAKIAYLSISYEKEAYKNKYT